MPIIAPLVELVRTRKLSLLIKEGFYFLKKLSTYVALTCVYFYGKNKP